MIPPRYSSVLSIFFCFGFGTDYLFLASIFSNAPFLFFSFRKFHYVPFKLALCLLVPSSHVATLPEIYLVRSGITQGQSNYDHPFGYIPRHCYVFLSISERISREEVAVTKCLVSRSICIQSKINECMNDLVQSSCTNTRVTRYS